MWDTVLDFGTGIVSGAADIFVAREQRRTEDVRQTGLEVISRNRMLIFGGIAVVIVVAVLAVTSSR